MNAPYDHGYDDQSVSMEDGPVNAFPDAPYDIRRVGEHWGEVIDTRTGEVKFDGDMTDVVQIADTMNGNNTISYLYYNGKHEGTR